MVNTMGQRLLGAAICTWTLLAAAANPGIDGVSRGAPDCIRWHRPGKRLFYKDTAIHPIGIALPSEFVAEGVPEKAKNAQHVAPFAGSTSGGDISQYSFGPADEKKYHAWYAKHRFAVTKRKGGWDALRHPEILAAGTVPLFEHLDRAPPYSVPFVPYERLLEAERTLMPYNDSLEAAYNATVEALLRHMRQCLTAEAMATHVLRTMGLWPRTRPLRLLYVSCGWGWTGQDDGWQGPVSIALFIGLQRLLQSVPGSRVVDAPPTEDAVWKPPADGPPTFMWYTYEQEVDADGKLPEDTEARSMMYGFGYSYARRLPRSLMATEEERKGILADIANRAFDAIIYGKVGPSQGCDPLPYLDDVQNAGYIPQRVALIYGGDFGLKLGAITWHVRLMGGVGTIFVREPDADPSLFRMRAASVLPPSCYLEAEWRHFFKLWQMRLDCWACHDVDAPVIEQLWPIFIEAYTSAKTANGTILTFGIKTNEHQGLLGDAGSRCWSGFALILLPLLTWERSVDTCQFAAASLAEASLALSRSQLGATDDFMEEFGVSIREVRAFVCDVCGGRSCHRGHGAGAGIASAAAASGAFSKAFDAEHAGRASLAELRARGALGAL